MGDDRQEPCGAGARRRTGVRAARFHQHRHQERAQCGRRLSRAQGFCAAGGPDLLHRQRQAIARGRACGARSDRRPLRRRGADLSIRQEHRRAARCDAGPDSDGRARRAAGCDPEGASRGAPVGAVSPAHHPESARRHHERDAARRHHARRRKARSSHHRGHRLRLPRRRHAAGRARTGPLHCDRQPVQEGRAPASRSASWSRRLTCAKAS
ncbi:hypothetical protein ABIA42_004184 [Bradyrhizobium sp. USDA 327]